MELSAGTMIGQNVRLVRLLGQGGMGSVWVADHLTLHTQVAVKFMATEITKNAEAVARFTREASAAAQIKSPHVVQTFDHGVTADGMPYIVMELLEGEDLYRRIQRGGPLRIEGVAQIVAQACKALSRAHSLGIVHRDIKPENIFLTDVDGDLLVKVLDFGIAKRSEEGAFSMTSTGAMIGTPYYMSPEQVMSAKSVDSRSDLWSVAVVAYHALTGAVPFEAETMGALCVAINAGQFLPPSQRRPGLDPAIDAWFVKALAREPAARFGNAKEMAQALLRAAGLPGGGAHGSDQYRSFALSTADAAAPIAAVSAQSVASSGSTGTGSAAPVGAGTLMDGTITSTRATSNRRALVVAGVAGMVLITSVAVAIGLVSRRGSSAQGSAAPEASAIAAADQAGAEVAPSPPEPAPSTSATAPAPSAASATAPAAKAPVKSGKPAEADKTKTAKPEPPPTKGTPKPAAPASGTGNDKYGF